jgi:hypothetical protein
MSIYESLRTGMNDFGHGDRFEGYPRMPVLNADQPAQIVGLTSPDKRPSIETLNLMPPFGRFFIECALPPELQFKVSNRVGDSDVTLHQMVREVGLDVSIHHNAKYSLTPAEQRPKKHFSCQPFYVTDSDPTKHDPLCKSNFHIYIGLGADGFPAPIPDANPAMLEKVFRENGTAFWVGLDGTAYNVMAHHQGSIRAGAWEKAINEGMDLPLVHEQTVSQFELFLPLLYAINSLHNRRTVLSIVQNSRQVRRAAQRSGQQPPDQKTIVVKDFVTIMQGARKAQAEGNNHPLGETIGHWRRYGVDGRTGLLFGKYRGTFFVPSFLRGNPDKGATDHDYVLKSTGVAA